MLLLLLLTALLLPTLLLAAPSSGPSCAPTAYTICTYTIDATPPDQHVHFTFTSTYTSLPASIVDPAVHGSVCDAASTADGNFPNEIPCTTGRASVEVDLRGRVGSGRYQVLHFWKCEGKNWMSSTPVDIDAASGGKTFQPENVRQMPCGAPTCP
ncbi:hypothetical protein BU23DRAFT_594393 [Bimuria novae-zelandiae CBS 107.79]|uniref:AA1-like domain-containing protein n=1 Tax=Bimuria novae-zelandiae CBS 107.79 TaxID=1447943 RepID=A0A6A5VSZ9_9PLEO|nr:hypothetical protein BU23DRAFT_594393 [Bimuria novae-zelandiae CBS 107.79]